MPCGSGAVSNSPSLSISAMISALSSAVVVVAFGMGIDEIVRTELVEHGGINDVDDPYRKFEASMPATAFVWARVGRLDLAPLLFCHLPDAPTYV
jgi:hypothetical protein